MSLPALVLGHSIPLDSPKIVFDLTLLGIELDVSNTFLVDFAHVGDHQTSITHSALAVERTVG